MRSKEKLERLVEEYVWIDRVFQCEGGMVLYVRRGCGEEYKVKISDKQRVLSGKLRVGDRLEADLIAREEDAGEELTLLLDYELQLLRIPGGKVIYKKRLI
ncbi:MAG TPA: hypothetical protein ENL16_02130 [Candidatus Woesearchaeota archaeon]|nr:hypothetical protein [Candidatus Woesearchaeota archaeon]